MKFAGLLLALLASAYASRIDIPQSNWLNSLIPDRRIQSFSFQPNKEYTLFYNGQLATGIPGSSHHHSATRIQALINLVFRSENKCLLRMSEVRFGKLNDDLVKPRNIAPQDLFEQVEILPELMERMQKPVMFRYENGMISEVIFDGMEEPWSANIKRGVLNLIQMNLNKERVIRELRGNLNLDRLVVDSDSKIESFVAIEKTIEGECETLYSVVSSPCRHEFRCRSTEAPVLNITKSINFEKCQRRPEIRYNERFQQFCPTCEERFVREERALRSSTVQRINAVCETSERKRCLIEQSTVVSQYNLVLLNEEANIITAYVNQTLELVRETEVETEISEPENQIRSDSDMMYTLDWDISKEEFFLNGEEQFDQTTPFAKLTNKIEFVKSILQKLLHQMHEQVSEEAPRQFTRLVKVLRMLKREELMKCHVRFFKQQPEQFTKEEHMKVKDILPEAMALCGTKDCIKHIVEVIKNNDITPLKASFVIRKFMDIRVVNKEMIENVMSICESSAKCERHPALKQAVYLTCGSMMRAMCTENTSDKLAIEFKREEPRCTPSVKQEMLMMLTSKLMDSDKMYDQVLCVKSLSNAGLDIGIKILEKIIRNVNGKYPSVLRVEAVLATRSLIDQIPSKIVKMLLPIFVNRDECAQVRMACVFQIMQCSPEKFVIDQIAQTLKIERHLQVSAFTYTLMKSLANSTEPCESRMADDIKLSLRQARYVPLNTWLFNSKYLRLVEKYHRSFNKGYSFDIASVYSNSSILPHTWVAKMNFVGQGTWLPHFLTVGIRQQGYGKVLSSLLRGRSAHLQSSLSDLLSGNFDLPKSQFDFRTELKELFNKLNLNERYEEMDNEKMFATLFLVFRNQEYGFIPLNREILPENMRELLLSEPTSINRLVKRAEELLRDCQIPVNFNTATFIAETERKIPTTIGLPLRASIKIPTVVQMNGVLKINVDKSSSLRKVNVELVEMKPSLVSTMVMKLESWSPIVNTGVKIVTSAKVFVPFTSKIQLDLTTQPTILSVVLKPEITKREEIVAIRSRPICYTLVWPKFLSQWEEPQERTIYGGEWTRVNKHNVEFGEKSIGIKFHSRGMWHRLPERHVSTTPLAFFAGPNNYVLTMQPGFEMPKEYIIRVTGNWFKFNKDGELTVNFDKFFEEETDSYLSRDSSEEIEDSIAHKNYYQSYKGLRPVTNDIKVEISTKGSSIRRRCSIDSTCKCDEQMKSCKCKFNIERTPISERESENWKLSSVFEILYPKIPLTVNHLTPEKQMMCKLNAKWGSAEEKYININMIGEQSRWMQELKDQSLYKRMFDNEERRSEFESLFSPVAQYKQTLKYGLMDEYKIDVDYKLNKFQKQYVSKFYSLMKNYFYWQTNVSDIEIRNPEDRLRVKLNIDPINRRYMNVTVLSPREESKIFDLPICPVALNAMNLRHLSTPSRSFYHLIRNTLSVHRPVCEHRTDRIRTFNQKSLDIPTSTCFSVLAKDCHSRDHSQFAILIKKLNIGSEKKVLKIVTPRVKVEVKLNSRNEFECKLNGEEQLCQEVVEYVDRKVLLLRCLNVDHHIVFDLPEQNIKVYFDGYATDIKTSIFDSEYICGLCETPRVEQWIQSPRDWFKRFLIEDGQCEHNEIVLQRPRTLVFDDDRFDMLPESLAGPYRETVWEVNPIEVTNIIEQGSEVCFSTKPVKKCPKHTYAHEWFGTVKNAYACIHKSDIQADELRLLARNQNVLDVDSLKPTFTENDKIPKSCRKY